MLIFSLKYVNLFVIAFFISLSANFIMLYFLDMFLLTYCLLVKDNTFLLLGMSTNFWLDAGHCRSYAVECMDFTVSL